MPRRLAPVAALTAVLALGTTACGAAAAPQVTFAVGATTVVAQPTQYCEDDFVTCRNDPSAPVSLAVPPGTPLQVTVPSDISDTPWQIVFTYRDGAGEQVDGRTTVFAPDTQESFALELPTPDSRLLVAQVQQYGPPPEVNPDTGEIEFPIRSSWVLTASG